MDKKIEVPVSSIYVSQTSKDSFYFVIESNGRYFRAEDLKEVKFEDKNLPVLAGLNITWPTNIFPGEIKMCVNNDTVIALAWGLFMPSAVRPIAKKICEYKILNLEQIEKLQELGNKQLKKYIERKEENKNYQKKRRKVLEDAQNFVDGLGK